MSVHISKLLSKAREYPSTGIFESVIPQALSISKLRAENRRYADSAGISEIARKFGFIPAFRDTHTGAVEISRFSDGTHAPFHLLDGLPDNWILEKNEDGRVLLVKASIEAGFVRQNQFYTREQATNAIKIVDLDE